MTNEESSNPSVARSVETLATAREQRQLALSAFAHDRPDVGMTLARSARAVQDVLGAISDPAEAREAFEASLGPDRRLDLLVVMGDIDDVAFMSAAPSDAFAAILKALLDENPIASKIAVEDDAAPTAAARPDVESDPDEEADGEADGDEDDDEAYFDDEPDTRDEIDLVALLPWVRKLRDRDDYAALLDEVFCQHAFRDWVLLALLADAEDPQQVSSASIDEFGLDVRESYERLRQLGAQPEDEYRLTRNELQDELERFRGEMRAPVKTAGQQQVESLKDTIDL